MDVQRATNRDRLGSAGGGRFVWTRLVLWLPACLALGALTGRVAVVAQSYGQPFLLFPLLMGVGLGAMTVALMRIGQVGNRPTVLLGTVLAASLGIVTQHYFSYLAVREAYSSDAATLEMAKRTFPDDVTGRIPQPPATFLDFLHADARKGRPLPGGYIAREGVAWATWAVDGLLVLLSALAMVIPALRQPYCNRCRSWYRVSRSGRIDVPTARRLAEIAEIPPAENPTAARYRLLNCNAACGRTGFELSWDESPGGTRSSRCWLDADRRSRITQVLDGVKIDYV